MHLGLVAAGGLGFFFLSSLASKFLSHRLNKFSGEIQHEEVDCDFVVVGAGCSGCALTSGLLKAGKKVLLIEGGPSNAFLHSKVMSPSTWVKAVTHGPPISRLYETSPQVGLKGRKIPAWRGTGGGGSSNVNVGLWSRGFRDDYEKQWPWKIQDIEESFDAVENAMGLDFLEPAPFGQTFIQMLYEAGAEKAKLSKWSEYGLMEGTRCAFKVNGSTSERISAWSAFIQPLQEQPTYKDKLEVWDNCKVCRVLMEGQRAIGLEVDIWQRSAGRPGRASGLFRSIVGRLRGAKLVRKHLKVRPNAEIILSSGSINTPQILMLSGIGPRDDLQKVGISTQMDLPSVGQNLQDHTLLAVANQCKRHLTSQDSNAIGIHGMMNFKSTSGVVTQLMLKDAWNSHELASTLLSGPFATDNPVLEGLRAVLDVLVGLLMAFPPLRIPLQQSVSAGLCITGPASSGNLTLRSSDPYASPVINPGTLSKEADWQALRELFDYYCQVIQTPTGQKFTGLS